MLWALVIQEPQISLFLFKFMGCEYLSIILKPDVMMRGIIPLIISIYGGKKYG